MHAHANKTPKTKNQSGPHSSAPKRSGTSALQLADNRPATVAQRKLQEMANDSSQVKSTIQFVKPKTIKREDDYFTVAEYQSKTKNKKNKKSHITINDDDQRGGLTPVNESGKTDIYRHIQGSEVQKEDSPYTSFTPGDHKSDKVYGQYEMEVNYDKLEEENRFDNTKIEAELKRRTLKDTGHTIKDVVPHDKIDDYVKNATDAKGSKLSKGKQNKLSGRLLALANTHRDQEILVKGKIPPYAVRRIGLRMDKYNILKQELAAKYNERLIAKHFSLPKRISESTKTDEELNRSKFKYEARKQHQKDLQGGLALIPGEGVQDITPQEPWRTGVITERNL